MDLIALDVSGIVFDGSLLLAIPLAFLAGLVSFLSPCVLPLAPGYLAYVAGLTGSDLADEADVNLSEQQDCSPGVSDGSSSAASGSAAGAGAGAAAAVVVEGLPSGASGFDVGAGSAAVADASALDADVDVAGSGASAPVGAEDADVDIHGKQKSSFVADGGFSSGASSAERAAFGSSASSPVRPATTSSASSVSSAASSAKPATTAGAVGLEGSLPHGASLVDLPTASRKVLDNGPLDGVQSGGPVAGAPVANVGRGRVLAGASLFVLGFSVVFVSYGAAFGGLGAWLLGHSRQISVVMGIVVIILGLGYLGLPALSNRMWWNADRRSHARPSRGLWGAPVLGVLFGLGWTPCIGPTLAAVQTLAFTEASAVRGATLSLAYCFGLGLPFIGMAVGLRAVAGATSWTKMHYLAISRFGGSMLMVIGVLLVTGWWNDIVAWLQGLVPGFTAVV